MRYKNISNEPKLILVNMNKTKIQPGQTAVVSFHDVQHTGSNMRFFESMDKAKEVEEEGYDEPQEVKTINQVMREREKEEQVIEQPSVIDEKGPNKLPEPELPEKLKEAAVNLKEPGVAEVISQPEESFREAKEQPEPTEAE